MHQKYDSLSNAGKRLARIPRFGRLIAKLPESRFALLKNEASTYWELFTYLSATDKEDETGLMDSGLRRGGRKLGWHDQTSEFPEREVIQVRRWQVGLAMYFLGAVAFEMFLGEDGDGKKPPRFIVEGELDLFLKRVRKRIKHGGGYVDNDDEALPIGNCSKDWKQLRQLNSHGLQYNLFSDTRERILFADISTQAFFAAYWIARWSDKKDRQQVRRWFPDPLAPESYKGLGWNSSQMGWGKQEIYKEFFYFLTDFPQIDSQSKQLTAFNNQRLQRLFAPLYDGHRKDKQGLPIRSTELIYRTWDMMQGTAAMAVYQSEFAQMLAAGNPVALGLLSDKSGKSSFIQLADRRDPRDAWDTGEFMMGDETSGKLRPQTVEPFRLHRYCVRNSEYELFDPRHQDHRAFADQPDILEHPVVNVSWYDSWCFARWIGGFELKFGNKTRKYTVTLPSETQWEYGCRCGETTPFTWWDRQHGDQIRSGDCNFNGAYPWPRPEDAESRTGGLSLGRTIRVDGADQELHVKPNPWGLHQMHGNVWEWCASWYTEGLSRVLRGGSWFYHGVNCRSGYRFRAQPANRFRSSGFRLAAVLVSRDE